MPVRNRFWENVFSLEARANRFKNKADVNKTREMRYHFINKNGMQEKFYFMGNYSKSLESLNIFINNKKGAFLNP